MKCDKCSSEAVTYIRYSGAHLCSEHFSDFVEKRVKKEIRRQTDLKGQKILAVGVSGGKDSMVVLKLLHDFLSPVRELKIHAITVDEGIRGYRPPSLKLAREFSMALNIPHHVIGFQDVAGKDLDDIIRSGDELTPCTYCGVFRRAALNMKAREIGADFLATGLNLDDTAQSVIMNIARGDMERLARMGPHMRVQPGLVPRIQPLRTIPEKEIYLYALLNNIPFSDAECPYASRAVRNTYREVINMLENDTPGSRHSILKSYDDIRDLLVQKYPPSALKRCKRCGEPANGDLCRRCLLVERIRGGN